MLCQEFADIFFKNSLQRADMWWHTGGTDLVFVQKPAIDWTINCSGSAALLPSRISVAVTL